MLPTVNNSDSSFHPTTSRSSYFLHQPHYPFPTTFDKLPNEDHFTDFSSINSIQDLDKMSKEQLELMSEEGEALDLLMHLCLSSQLKPIQNHLRASELHLASIAEENLNLKSEYESKKDELAKKLEEWRDVKKGLMVDVASFTDKCNERFNTQSILDNLRVAVMEAEEKADATSDKFTNGEMNADEFLKCFIQQKKLYHKRKSKEDKLLSLSELH